MRLIPSRSTGSASPEDAQARSGTMSTGGVARSRSPASRSAGCSGLKTVRQRSVPRIARIAASDLVGERAQGPPGHPGTVDLEGGGGGGVGRLPQRAQPARQVGGPGHRA